MKLSKHTLNMLKNFSDINMSIEIKKGNLLRTVSVQKNILAQAELEDEFPKDFAIYELNRFLGAVSLFD
ncbi:MAG: DNA polymerase, partial [SAR202 cluster bacterium]|nr:DNA polymerase [SAR202 cluster bacterium]